MRGFADLSRSDIAIVGGNNASLGEMAEQPAGGWYSRAWRLRHLPGAAARPGGDRTHEHHRDGSVLPHLGRGRSRPRGDGPSDYPEFARFLIGYGIDSISVSPDSFLSVKRAFAVAEARSGMPEVEGIALGVSAAPDAGLCP